MGLGFPANVCGCGQKGGSRLSSHPATGGKILVSADAAGGAGINQHNIEWAKLVANAFKLSFDLSSGNDMPVGQTPKIELDAAGYDRTQLRTISAAYLISLAYLCW